MTFDQAVLQLLDWGLHEIEHKYGPSGRSPKIYHNVEHAHDVMTAGQQLAELAIKNKKINQRDMRLITLASCYHDIDQDSPRGDREDESIRIVADKMKANPAFTTQDIAKVSVMIDATKVEFVNGKIIQNYTDDYLTKLLADSDLVAFGRPFNIYWDRSLKLADENGDINVTKDIDFINSQIDVLSKHQFATSEAEVLFPNKAKNITRLRQMRSRHKAAD